MTSIVDLVSQVAATKSRTLLTAELQKGMKNPMMKMLPSGPPITPHIVPVACTSLLVKLDARKDSPIVRRPKKITTCIAHSAELHKVGETVYANDNEIWS